MFVTPDDDAPKSVRPARGREDFRVARAREALAESEAAKVGGEDYSGPAWHGRLHVVLENLLSFVDEQENQR